MAKKYYKYWRLDCTNKDDKRSKFSVHVKTDENVPKSSIIELAVEKDAIHDEVLLDYNIVVEEFTNDFYQMAQWQELAVEI